MNKTDEELNQAEKMAKRHGVRMCDENGDTHGEELYCVGIDDIADIIREALADHSGDSNEMVADTNPLSVFAKECVLGAYTYDELPDAARLALKRAKKAEPVKQEPVALSFPREPKPENAMGWTIDYGLIRQIAEDIGDQEFHPGYEGIELTLMALEHIYAAPVSAKREWVDLTVSDLDAIIEKHYDDEMDLKAMILDGIAAFKEKNK